MEPQFVNVAAFSSKFRTKREIFTFLAVDGEAYLPPFETVTVYFLKDIIQGQKKCKYPYIVLTIAVVSTHAVRHLPVPQYPNLSMEKILDYLAQYEAMHLHMPSERHEIVKLPRAWVINVGASVVGQPFVDWCGERIKTRNTEMARDRNLLIKMDPRLDGRLRRERERRAHAEGAGKCRRHLTEHVVEAPPDEGADRRRQGAGGRAGAGQRGEARAGRRVAAGDRRAEGPQREQRGRLRPAVRAHPARPRRPPRGRELLGPARGAAADGRAGHEPVSAAAGS